MVEINLGKIMTILRRSYSSDKPSGNLLSSYSNPLKAIVYYKDNEQDNEIAFFLEK